MKLALIEDEEKARSIFENLLRFYSKERSIDIKLDMYTCAEDFLKEDSSRYDIVFFDIQLPGIDGISAADTLRKTNQDVLIVFLTNMSHLAIKGYKVSAIDFIVKPLIYNDLSDVLDKAIKRIESSHRSNSIVIENYGRRVAINISDLTYAEVSGHKIIYHSTKESAEEYGNMQSLEKRLKQYGFIQCYRSIMVNPLHINSIKQYDVVVNGDTLPISHLKKKEFLQAYNDWVLKTGR